MENAPSEPPWDLATKIDILKHAQSLQMVEVQNRRTREYQIFSWTSGLLVALIGALLVFPRAPQTIWSIYGVAGRLLAALAVAVLASQSIVWQIRNRQAAQDMPAPWYASTNCFTCLIPVTLTPVGTNQSCHPHGRSGAATRWPVVAVLMILAT
jgi:hypothetical protein